MGRLSPEKNFADAVRIWQKVAAVCPDWRLDIYGGGKQESRLRELIAECGMSGKVNLMGPSRTLAAEYATADGVLITSRYEGFCLVAVEAMASGVPVVALDCPGGIAEVLASGGGVLVPRGGDSAGSDAAESGPLDEAAQAVCRLIADPALRAETGRRGLEAARAYSPDAVMARWKSLFDKLTCTE